MLANHTQCVGGVTLHKVLGGGVLLYNISFSPVLASEISYLKNASFEPDCSIVSQGTDRQSLDKISPKKHHQFFSRPARLKHQPQCLRTMSCNLQLQI